MMRPLNLEYARTRTTKALGTAVLIAGAVVAGLAFERWEEIDSQRAYWGELVSKGGRAQRGTQQVRISPQEAALLKERLKQATRTLAEVGLPWNEVFVALEKAYTPDVAILSVRPEPATELMIVTAESQDAQTMLRFVRQLRSQPMLKNVHLAAHKTQGDGKRAIRFSVRLHWNAQDTP